MDEWHDEDGYPTELACQYIKNWRPDTGSTDFKPLFEFIRELWYYPDYFTLREDGRTYEISTGGWSGNEDLIDALQQNLLAWSVTWISSRRGGHFVFELPRWTNKNA